MSEEKIYPLLFEPVFKDYIWGGRNLERMFGRNLPPGITAESWEIAAHEDGTTRVKNGYFKGQALTDVQDVLGLDLIGRRNNWAYERGKFPLLIKLLDSNSALSVQVHPDDEYALAHEGNELGKTEMWVVLNAEPDAALILGIMPHTTPKAFRAAIKSGNLETFLHRLPIKTGDVICVPSGMLHAILKGAIIAEIQQNSNTTYRVYDWNRVGKNGKPRPLHIDKAMDVIDFSQVEPGLAQPRLISQSLAMQRSLLCRNQYFTTEQIDLHVNGLYKGICDGTTLEIWGVIQGQAEIAGLSLQAVQFVLLPAVLGEFEIVTTSNCTLLRTYVE